MRKNTAPISTVWILWIGKYPGTVLIKPPSDDRPWKKYVLKQPGKTKKARLSEAEHIAGMQEELKALRKELRITKTCLAGALVALDSAIGSEEPTK